jgi:hypothetical protein
VSFLRLPVGFLRVLHGLPGQLVSAQVIAFLVMGGRSPVRMRGKFVEFGCSLMRIARHTFILPRGQETCPRVFDNYAVRIASDLSPEIAACAAANLAIGTRYGEQET